MNCQQWFLLVFIPTLIAVFSSSYPLLRQDSGLGDVSIFGWTETRPEGIQDETRRILLLTAHPDDECMFFAPTILKLSAFAQHHNQSSPELHSLCLSNGDADGLGVRRELELQGSLDVLGISRDNSMILSHVCVLIFLMRLACS